MRPPIFAAIAALGCSSIVRANADPACRIDLQAALRLSFSNGFAVYNTPDQLASRVAANANPVTVFNQYRSGVGYYNLTSVQPMRILELGLKFRF